MPKMFRPSAKLEQVGVVEEINHVQLHLLTHAARIGCGL
jgi:hypothetical protein